MKDDFSAVEIEFIDLFDGDVVCSSLWGLTCDADNSCEFDL